MAFFLGKRPLRNVTVNQTIPVAPAPSWLPTALQTPPELYILSGFQAELPDGRPYARAYVHARKRGEDWLLEQ